MLKLFEKTRTCPYTQDEVKFHNQDVVVSENARYTMKYLNLEPLSVHVLIFICNLK